MFFVNEMKTWKRPLIVSLHGLDTMKSAAKSAAVQITAGEGPNMLRIVLENFLKGGFVYQKMREHRSYPRLTKKYFATVELEIELLGRSINVKYHLNVCEVFAKPFQR